MITPKLSDKSWWKTPESGEEYHTARVWSQIASAADAAGDKRRAAEAREAADAEVRNCGAA